MTLSHLEKKYAREIAASVLEEIHASNRAASLRWDHLESRLSRGAKQLKERFQGLSPKKYGSHRGAVCAIEKSNLVIIENQRFTTTDETKTLSARLLPRQTYRDFHRMNHSLKKVTGRTLVIKSGYRSPAYQLYIFIYNLRHNDWDISKTLETVALPGRSEHAGELQAIDVRAKRHHGPESTYDFSRTPEFTWMKKHANDFGFEMSYPKGNDTGTDFEPWHWQHQKSTM